MDGRIKRFNYLWTFILLLFLVSCSQLMQFTQSEENPEDLLQESSIPSAREPTPLGVTELPFYQAVAPGKDAMETEILDFRDGKLLFSVEGKYSRTMGEGVAAVTQRVGVYDIPTEQVLWEARLPEENFYFYSSILTENGLIASGILLDEREETYRIYEFRECEESCLLLEGTVGGRFFLWPEVVPREQGDPLVIIIDEEDPAAYLIREEGPEPCPIPVQGRFYSNITNVRWQGNRSLTFWEVDGKGQFLCWDPEGEYFLVPLPEERKILSYSLMEDGILACLQSQDGKHLYSELHYLPLNGSEPFWTYSSRHYEITEVGDGQAVSNASGNPDGLHEILVSEAEREIKCRPLELPGVENHQENIRIALGPEGSILNLVQAQRLFLCTQKVLS